MEGVNLAYVEVLTSGEDALAPCVMLSLEKRAAYGTGTTVVRRYLFDAPEEIVRFSGSHQIKLGKIAGVFCSSGRGAAGLPELILACAEQGMQNLHVRGPRGTTEYTKTVSQTIGYPRGMQLLTVDARPNQADGLCYEDDYVRIWAVEAISAQENSVTCDVPPPPPPPPPPPSPSMRDSKRRRVTGGPSAVGYKCELRDGGKRLLVFPEGCAAVKKPETSDVVFHLGPRPKNASIQEISVSAQGRRRGLWKSAERLCRWRALSSTLVPQMMEQKQRSLPVEACGDGPGIVLRAYLRPANAGFESGSEERLVASDANAQQEPVPAGSANIGQNDSDEESDIIRAETLKECGEWGLAEALRAAEDALVKVACAPSRAEAPEMLFLGTGSAKPTSKRGQSAILLRSGGFSALLDCGGGTWAQLVRLLGLAEARQVVDDLQLVWISHHHADHCAGLPTILAQRTVPGLRVVASNSVQRYWRAALAVAGCGRGGAVAAPIFSVHKAFKLPEAVDWPLSIRSVPVVHCPEAYGIIIRTESSRIVYSGDCRPSDELINAAAIEGAAGWVEDTTEKSGLDSGGRPPPLWLVHEATFNPDEQANAEKVRHSTTAEALEVARKMGAEGLILTHFSQRYPSIVLGGGNDEAKNNEETVFTKNVQQPLPAVCKDTKAETKDEADEGGGALAEIEVPLERKTGTAFDGLLISTSQMEAFGAAREVFEEYWSKRHERARKHPSTKLDDPRQPLPGAALPRSMFVEEVKGKSNEGDVVVASPGEDAKGTRSGVEVDLPTLATEGKSTSNDGDVIITSPAADAKSLSSEQNTERRLENTSPTPATSEAPTPMVAKSPELADKSKGETFQTMKRKRAQGYKGCSLDARLRGFYLRVNPEKSGDADRVARLFEGRERLLNAKLRARYNGDDLETLGFCGGSSSSSSSSSSPSRRPPAARRGNADASIKPSASAGDSASPADRNDDAKASAGTSSVISNREGSSNSGVLRGTSREPTSDCDSPKRRDKPKSVSVSIEPVNVPISCVRRSMTPPRQRSSKGEAVSPRFAKTATQEGSPAQPRRFRPVFPPPSKSQLPSQTPFPFEPSQAGMKRPSLQEDSGVDQPSAPTTKKTFSAPASRALPSRILTPPAPPSSSTTLAASASALLNKPSGYSNHDISDDCSPSAAVSAAIEAKRRDLAVLRARLRQFYLRHNPEKADDADKVARLFAGREADLNEKLRDRYGGADLTSVPKGLPEIPRKESELPRRELQPLKKVPTRKTFSSSSSGE